MNIEQLKDYQGDAIVDLNQTYSYPQLAEQIDKYYFFLEKKISTGDVLIVSSDYSFYSISLLFALSKINCIVVPIVKGFEEEFDSKAKACNANINVNINDSGKLIFSELASVRSDYEGYVNIINLGHSGIVLFTSGTTGEPKVMVHDFTKLLESYKAPGRQKKLRFLLMLLFDHIGGLNTLVNCLNNGSPVVVPKDRNPGGILDLIEEKKVQILPTSPTFLNLMLMVDDFEDRNLSTLKLITYGTERMPQELLNKINRLIPRVKLLQTFGTSETGIMKTVSKSSNSLFFKIDDPDVEYKIIDEQLYIKSKTSVKEYKNENSEKFLEGGWFSTGDLVEVDDEGFMKIVGRINDIINVGGLKVMPAEVEEVVNSVDGVQDSTAYGMINSITGQIVSVKVVLEDIDRKKEIVKAIKSECRDRLDKFKRPVKIEICEELKFTNRLKKKI